MIVQTELNSRDFNLTSITETVTKNMQYIERKHELWYKGKQLLNIVTGLFYQATSLDKRAQDRQCQLLFFVVCLLFCFNVFILDLFCRLSFVLF